MSVTYAGSNNYGPFGPNVAGGSSGIAVVSAEPDPTTTTVARTEPQAPSGTVNTNTGRASMATQTALAPMEFDGPQSGCPAISNAAAVCTAIAGESAQSICFVQWTGPYQNP